MKNIIKIIIFLIIIVGVIMVLPFKNYELKEYREFKCKGVEGFTFSYPVFKDFPVRGPSQDKANPGLCFINFDIPEDLIIAKPINIEVIKNKEGTKSETDESLLRGPTKNAKTNLNGVLYDRFDEKDFGEWYEFYDDYRSVSIVVTIPKNSRWKGFSHEEFWKKVVETFKWNE